MRFQCHPRYVAVRDFVVRKGEDSRRFSYGLGSPCVTHFAVGGGSGCRRDL